MKQQLLDYTTDVENTSQISLILKQQTQFCLEKSTLLTRKLSQEVTVIFLLIVSGKVEDVC